MNVLYLSHRRYEERKILASIQDIAFTEIPMVLRKSPLEYLRNLYLSYQAAKNDNPDIILLEGPGMSFIIGVMIARRYKIPLATRIKGSIRQSLKDLDYYPNAWQKFLQYINIKAGLWILKKSDILLPLSEPVNQEIKLITEGQVPSFVVHIAPRENVTYHPKPATFTENYLLTVTNFNYWQKVEPMVRLIPVIHNIIKSYPIKWKILGDGRFFQKCLTLTRPYHDLVQFLGRTDSRPYYCDSALFFIHLSLMDALPTNVLLESASYKVPIIMNRDCPVSEFIVDGQSGVLFDLEDIAGLEKLLQRMLEDERYRRELAENGYRLVKEKYSVEKIGYQLSHALQEGRRLYRQKYHPDVY